jgi:transketolase
VKIMIKFAGVRGNSGEMRGAYAESMRDLVRVNDKVVAMEADLIGVSGMAGFRSEFPDKLIDVGIAEQSLLTVAAGLSLAGYIPFTHTFAAFTTRRSCDQLYISCAYSHANVKIIGSDPGITCELNGGTHQGMEDIAIVRPIPNITILEPSDAVQMRWAIHTAAETEGLFYIRMHRKDSIKVYEEGSEFKIGKAVVVQDGADATILSCGPVMLEQALKASELLSKGGLTVRVVDLVSIKPIDKELVIRCARETGAIIVAENHSTIGGAASAVAEILAENATGVPFRSIGIKDSFGEVGQLNYLLERFGMTAGHIMAAVKDALARE